MERSQIRYALFRCKAGTSDKKQDEILKTYQPQLDELGLDVCDFAIEWDIDKKDYDQVVYGKVAKKYNTSKSLFNGEGKLKE